MHWYRCFISLDVFKYFEERNITTVATTLNYCHVSNIHPKFFEIHSHAGKQDTLLCQMYVFSKSWLSNLMRTLFKLKQIDKILFFTAEIWVANWIIYRLFKLLLYSVVAILTSADRSVDIISCYLSTRNPCHFYRYILGGAGYTLQKATNVTLVLATS